MSAIETDERNLSALNDAYGEMQLALDLHNAKLDRLLESAFENKAKAWRSVNGLTRGYGAEATIVLLEDRGWLSRSHYFGFLRGHLFAQGARAAAHAALQELPTVLRERELLLTRRDDLLRARRHVLERLDRQRLTEGRQTADFGRSTGRERG